MVPQDVSETTPSRPRSPLLVARLHVDLCRLASAICQRRHPTAAAAVAV